MTETHIEDLMVVNNEREDDPECVLELVPELWKRLRVIPTLTRLELRNWPTSSLLVLTSAPQIEDVTLEVTRWNLDDQGKRAIASLENVHVLKLYGESKPQQQRSAEEREEIAFWSSLFWVDVPYSLG
jgi:hypothetical protein